MSEIVANSPIASIRIDGLFGLYKYQLPAKGQLSNATILYGDNGTGKSTLLRLVFHLLSAANDKGHRSALHKTDFKSLEVCLDSGIRLRAHKLTDSDPEVLKLKSLTDKKLLRSGNMYPPTFEDLNS